MQERGWGGVGGHWCRRRREKRWGGRWCRGREGPEKGEGSLAVWGRELKGMNGLK